MVDEDTMSVSPSEHNSNRVVALERVLDDLHESFIVFVAVVAADVAEHLVAPRMAHRFGLGNLARVFALADRRVVVRQLPDAVRRQLVETAVADMPDGDLPIDHERQRQHAGHAVVGRRFLRLPEDFVVGERDRLADALGRRAERTRQPGQDLGARDRGGDLAGGLPADAVDDREDPPIGIAQRQILVVGADAAGVAPERRGQAGGAVSRSSLSHRGEPAEPADDGHQEEQEREPHPIQPRHDGRST